MKNLRGGSTAADALPPTRHQHTQVLDVYIDVLYLAHDLTLVHHHNPVRKGADLVQVLADEQDRRAVVALFQQALVNVLRRADIHAAGSCAAISTPGARDNSRASTSFWMFPPERLLTKVSVLGVLIS